MKIRLEIANSQTHKLKLDPRNIPQSTFSISSPISKMDIVYHPGVNGSDPVVEFYPYTPSRSAGFAFLALFGIATIVHIILTIPFRAAYFIPLVIG